MDNWGTAAARSSSSFRDMDALLSSFHGFNPIQKMEIIYSIIRRNDINALTSIMNIDTGTQFSTYLLTYLLTNLLTYSEIIHQQIYGYEGADVYSINKNAKNGRVYTFTGNNKDGYFYPLHLAAEQGNKAMVQILLDSSADAKVLDYKGENAESKCNLDSINAFYAHEGLVYEAKERYDGKYNTNGLRTGQGLLYYKPVGFKSEERLLYSGSFRDGTFEGYGTLYWPGKDKYRYAGRFKNGQMHGSGVEFDKNGERIYQGTFRLDKREGRGEEYAEGIKVYKGEFSNNLRHGFGIAYFGDHHEYIGRFVEGVMDGLGIYKHPDGDRYEGLFYNNKPEGTGSFYKINIHNNLVSSSTHGLWQAGRCVKELATPFIPSVADLPDIRKLNNIISSIISKANDNSDEYSNPQGVNEINFVSPVEEIRRRRSTYEDISQWKQLLADYVKITVKEAKSLGIKLVSSNLGVRRFSVDNGDVEDEYDDNNNDVDDEVLDYHFLNCTQLFVSYVYVSSAAKIFEGRLATSDMNKIAPDFEGVYYLVLDTIDKYNELWQNECNKLKEFNDGNAEDARQSLGNKVETDVDIKRKIFMTEKEKKDEEIQKQRNLLASSEILLEPEIEYKISSEVVANLEAELIKLLSEEETASIEESDEVVVVAGNEFAAELLFIIRTANEWMSDSSHYYQKK